MWTIAREVVGVIVITVFAEMNAVQLCATSDSAGFPLSIVSSLVNIVISSVVFEFMDHSLAISDDISIISGMKSAIGLCRMRCPNSTVESVSEVAVAGKMIRVVIMAILAVMGWMIFIAVFDFALPGHWPHLHLRAIARKVIGVSIVTNFAKV